MSVLTKTFRATAVPVLMLAAAGVSGCTGAGERVYERALSPDGTKEAVLMRCRDAADPSISHLTGAVFARKGQGCDEVAREGLASFSVTNAATVEDPGATMQWQDQQVIFDIAGDRAVMTRQAKGGAALDMIQLKGDFEGADILDGQ